MKALRDLRKAYQRTSRVPRQHGKHIVDNDALLSQRIPLAHLDFPQGGYRQRSAFENSVYDHRQQHTVGSIRLDSFGSILDIAA